MFMALSVDSDSSLISNDGVTWELRTLTGVNTWNAICFGANMFVAVPWSTASASLFRFTLATARMAYVTNQYRTVSYDDVNVKTASLNATELTLQSNFTNEADALTEATRQLTMRKVRRDYLAVTIPRTALTEIPYLGKKFTITYPRFGYDVGKDFIFIGYDMELSTNSIVLYFWG
jgi:hypothetical protein